MTWSLLAVGARTPVGMTAASTAAAIRAGIRRTAPLSIAPVDDDGDPRTGSIDPRLPPTLDGVERLWPLVRSALCEVVEDLGAAVAVAPVEVVVVLPMPREGMDSSALDQVGTLLVSRISALVPNAMVRRSGRGSVGLVQALEGLERGASCVTLIVAADTLYAPRTLLALEEERRFGPGARTPLVPAEAAACLAVASSQVARQLRRTPLLEIEGVGVAHESVDVVEDEVGSLGLGLTAAIRTAMTGLQLPADAVDTVYANINGERWRSEEWGFVELRLPTAFRCQGPSFAPTALGEIGAAGPVVACVLAAQAWQRDYAAGPRALVVCACEEGPRGALLLRAPKGHHG